MTPEAIVMRTAIPADAGEIFTVQRAAFVAEAQRYGEPDLPPLTEAVDEIRDVIHSGTALVIVGEIERGMRRRIIASGRLAVRDGIGHVGRLAVTPDLQGMGIGGRLLAAVHTARADVRVFELYAGGESDDTIRWYAAHGYERVGSTVDAVGVPLAIMRRPQLHHLRGAPRPRVACYVSRKDASDVLVFEHDGISGAGLQVPAGGIRTGETVADAAIREVFEETGLECRFAALLGYSDRPSPDDGSPRRTAYVHLTVDYAPEEWEHRATGSGMDAGMIFRCRWVGRDVELADDQHEFFAAEWT